MREVHSLERLLDQVVLALHIDVTHLTERHRKVLEDIYGSTKALAGRRVLIVDDDIRNIFALSSVLEDYGMDIKTADNGREAIDVARKGELDVVLMDIMMPEMDGLETTREIRKIPALQGPADRGGDREGDEGRPRALHRGGRLGLPVQAGGPRAAAHGPQGLAAALRMTP